jgi:hypothetical protein
MGGIVKCHFDLEWCETRFKTKMAGLRGDFDLWHIRANDDRLLYRKNDTGLL